MGRRDSCESLKKRLERRKHALIVVAEGAGQELFPTEVSVMLQGTENWEISGYCSNRGYPPISRSRILRSI